MLILIIFNIYSNIQSKYQSFLSTIRNYCFVDTSQKFQKMVKDYVIVGGKIKKFVNKHGDPINK